jgi:hypothetical protein
LLSGSRLQKCLFQLFRLSAMAQKNTEFGLACVFLGAAFFSTIIPAVKYFLNFGIMTKRTEQLNEMKFQLENFMFHNSFIRDLSFCLLSCLVYFLVMASGSISLLGTI